MHCCIVWIILLCKINHRWHWYDPIYLYRILTEKLDKTYLATCILICLKNLANWKQNICIFNFWLAIQLKSYDVELDSNWYNIQLFTKWPSWNVSSLINIYNFNVRIWNQFYCRILHPLNFVNSIHIIRFKCRLMNHNWLKIWSQESFSMVKQKVTKQCQKPKVPLLNCHHKKLGKEGNTNTKT